MNDIVVELEKLKTITGKGIFPISKEIVKAPDMLEQFAKISNSIASLSIKEVEQIVRRYDALINKTADWLKLKDNNANINCEDYDVFEIVVKVKSPKRAEWDAMDIRN